MSTVRQLIALSLLTVRTAAAGEGEELPAPESAAAAQPAGTAPVVDVYDTLPAGWPWRYVAPQDTESHLQPWLAPLLETEFAATNLIDRLSEYKALSILTLGRFGDTSLILGVNSDGVFGVHFDSQVSVDDDSLAELARMPYLRRETRRDEDQR